MMDNNREQRCIELYKRLKNQFLRSHVLDDAYKGLMPTQESNDYNKRIAAKEATVMVRSLIRLSAHMDVDDFNTNWFFYSDYIYQDEDDEAQESLQQTLDDEQI